MLVVKAGRVSVVLVDLDDTLYPQSQWLKGVWTRVATAGSLLGLPDDAFEFQLRRFAAMGSDRGHIIDRALHRIGADGIDIEPLLRAFWSHRPVSLSPYPGVKRSLQALGTRHQIIVVTDGDPDVQRHKVAALGLVDFVDAVIVSDDVDRSHRKPSPEPLQRAIAIAGCQPRDAVMIGDRPDKDVLAANRAGIRSIRVTTGEYSRAANDPMAWHVVKSFAQAAEIVSGRSWKWGSREYRLRRSLSARVSTR